jgi:hypothetical protein
VFEGERREREGEIAEEYERRKLEIEREVRARPTGEQVGALRKMQNRRLKLVAQLESARKELLKQQAVAAQNVRAFRMRSQSVVKGMREFGAGLKAEFAGAKEGFDSNAREMEEGIENANRDRKVRENGWANEIVQLRNAQKITRAESQYGEEQQKVRIRRISNSDELTELATRLREELQKESDRLGNARLKHSQDLKLGNEKLREHAVRLENELQEIHRELELLASSQEKEVGAAIARNESEKKQEEDEFQSRMKIVKRLPELRHLQEVLVGLSTEGAVANKADELETGLVDASDIAAALEREFEEQKNKSELPIKELREQLRIQETEKARVLNLLHKDGIAQFSSSFEENSEIADLIREYESRASALAKTLSEIDVPGGPVMGPDLESNSESPVSAKTREIEAERARTLQKFDAQYHEIELQCPPPYDPATDIDETEQLNIKSQHQKLMRELDEVEERLNGTLTDLRAFTPLSAESQMNGEDSLATLRAELEALHERSQRSIVDAESEAVSWASRLKEEVEGFAQNHADTMARETDQFKECSNEWRTQTDALHGERQEKEEAVTATLEAVMKAHGETKQRLVSQYENDLASLTEQIAIYNGASSWNLAAEELAQRLAEKLRLESQRIEAEMTPLKETLCETRQSAEIDVEQKQKECDSLRLQIETKSRDEERSKLEMLEAHLKLRTAELRLIGQEFLEYRAGLRASDWEFSERFGIPPKVAVMRRPATRRMTTHGRKLPLPPLTPGPVV